METLIPQWWFTGLPQWLLVLILVAALALLIKGADWLVGGAAGIAYRLRISKVVVAATIVSMGTTSPETAVSVTAAWSGQAGLALGNAIGSVICNAALIFGLGSVMTRLPADRYVLVRQGLCQLLAVLAVSAICFLAWMTDGAGAVLARSRGVLLLLALGAYVVLSIIWGRRHPSGEPFMPAEEGDTNSTTRQPGFVSHVAVSVVGLLAVLIASRFFVAAITVLCEVHWHVPKVVVAATIVAIGTSLPELVVSLTSVYKGHGEMLVGNVIGANVLNIVWVTGAAAAVAPLPLLDASSRSPAMFLWLHVPTMLLVILLFSAFIVHGTRRGRFPKGIGWPLLAIYAGYIVVQLIWS